MSGMNDRLQRFVEQVELERKKCIVKREEKVKLRDHIGAVGWDGKVQGLSMALAIMREPDAKNIFQPLEGSPGWVRYPPTPNDADCRHDRGGTVGQRLKQMEINCRWLMDITDRIHDALCPGQYGTWQDRAKQAVEAAERLASNAPRQARRDSGWAF